MQITDQRGKTRRGRPRTFDRDAAVDTAMRMFWERGFEATSISELSAAIGIRSASLYAAFGDKTGLFDEAVQRYQAQSVYALEALALAPTSVAVSSLLTEAARHVTGETTPSGCLVVLSALSCDRDASPRVERILAAQRHGFEDMVRARLEQGRAEGDLAAGLDLPALARYVMMIFQGLAVAARQGQIRADLEKSIELALGAWPDGPCRHDEG